MKKEMGVFTLSSNTNDREAIIINNMFNDVERMIGIGKELVRVKNEVFGNDLKRFRRWIKQNLDKGEKSCFRYMIMAGDEEFLKAGKIIKLDDAYQLLDLDGNVDPERVLSLR